MTDGDCYSPLKVFHHRDRVDALRRGERPALLHVQLVPTNRCNQGCSFCAYRMKGYSSSGDFHPQDELPVAKALEIIDNCAEMGVKAVEITGGGEPTMHPEFPRICDRISEMGMQYAVVTNGSRLSVGALEALRGAVWVRFSIDAGCPETYADTRRSRPEVFHTVRGNLHDLCRTKGKDGPVVGVGFVVTRDNWREVVQAAKNAREDGAGNFRISAVFQNEGAEYFREFRGEAVRVIADAKSLEGESFRVFDLFGDRIGDLRSRSPLDPDCLLQHLIITYVGADQCVYRCCVVAYSPLGLVGPLKWQSFKALWTSEETGRRLQEFDARRCPRCMFNGKNRTIRYAVNPDPRHVNFL